MSKLIKISYKYNRENIDKLFDSSYKYLFDHSRKRYVGWFFIALSQFGVVAALKKGAFGLLIFSTLVLIYWYYGKRLIAKKRAINSYEKSPFKNQDIKITASESGLDIDSSDTPTHWNWDEIDEVVSAGDDLLLHREPHFYYIPASGFSSLEEKSRFKSLAKKFGRLK